MSYMRAIHTIWEGSSRNNHTFGFRLRANIPSVIRVARIFCRGALPPPLKKLPTFLVVALKTEAETTKLTTPTVQISSISSNNSTLALPGVHALPGGSLTTIPCEFSPQIFFALGVHVHPVHPLATPLPSVLVGF